MTLASDGRGRAAQRWLRFQHQASDAQAAVRAQGANGSTTSLRASLIVSGVTTDDDAIDDADASAMHPGLRWEYPGLPYGAEQRTLIPPASVQPPEPEVWTPTSIGLGAWRVPNGLLPIPGFLIPLPVPAHAYDVNVHLSKGGIKITIRTERGSKVTVYQFVVVEVVPIYDDESEGPPNRRAIGSGRIRGLPRSAMKWDGKTVYVDTRRSDGTYEFVKKRDSLKAQRLRYVDWEISDRPRLNTETMKDLLKKEKKRAREEGGGRRVVVRGISPS